LQSQGLYPKIHIDVEVSSGEDDVPKTDASTHKRKAPAGDDAEDRAASSAEPIASNPISSDALEQTDPSIADQATLFVPPAAGGCGHKSPPPAIKWKQPLYSEDQVMIQVELPPYHEPLSPLDLVIVEIIFGRLLKHFDTYHRLLLLVL
jgi:hypothetical protein